MDLLRLGSGMCTCLILNMLLFSFRVEADQVPRPVHCARELLSQDLCQAEACFGVSHTHEEDVNVSAGIQGTLTITPQLGREGLHTNPFLRLTSKGVGGLALSIRNKKSNCPCTRWTGHKKLDLAAVLRLINIRAFPRTCQNLLLVPAALIGIRGCKTDYNTLGQQFKSPDGLQAGCSHEH